MPLFTELEGESDHELYDKVYVKNSLFEFGRA